MTKQLSASSVAVLLAGALLAITLSTPARAQTFFAQPQSHLGRLVQSITSPLVISPSAGYDSSELSAGPSGEESPGADSASSTGGEHDQDSHYQHYRMQQQPSQASPNKYRHSQQNYHSSQHQHQGLQQAPSQQRGVPQHYASGSADGQANLYGNSDNDDAEPSTGYLGASPMGASSQSGRQQQQQQQNLPMGYNMGAYLGPTIDDKEIQGAFNSDNDERDEDDSPAGYGAAPSPSSGASRQRGLGSEASSAPRWNSHSSAASTTGGRTPSGRGHSYGYDDAGESSSADDDGDEPSARPGAARHGLSQAASQYRGQRQQQPRARTNQQLDAAANGYAPYGPIDLQGLMAAANGGQPQGGYDVYNGDGSYAGPMNGDGFGPFGGESQRGNGRRQKAASMSNQFGYGPMGGYGPQQRRPTASGDDDAENEDED